MLGIRMLQGHHLSVMEAQTADGFRRQVVQFAQSLGFRTVSAMAVVDRSLSTSDFYSVDNTPAEFQDFYHDEYFARRDPVMQHCKHASIPIIWDQNTYIENGAGEMWEHQAAYGYRSGIALGLHLPNGRHFGLGVDTDRSHSWTPRRLTRVVAELQLFAVHAQETAFRILVPAPIGTSARPNLTTRELEALKWTMDGMTAWEIGEALNVSERTAVFHLQNAMRKLGCISKYQAVLKAIRLGFLA